MNEEKSKEVTGKQVLRQDRPRALFCRGQQKGGCSVSVFPAVPISVPEEKNCDWQCGKIRSLTESGDFIPRQLLMVHCG